MLAFLLILVSFGLVFLGVVFQVMMVVNRKPGVRLFQARFLYNPFNIQFAGKYFLTEKGIFWRNLSWFCLVLFMILVWSSDMLCR